MLILFITYSKMYINVNLCHYFLSSSVFSNTFFHSLFIVVAYLHVQFISKVDGKRQVLYYPDRAHYTFQLWRLQQ